MRSDGLEKVWSEEKDQEEAMSRALPGRAVRLALALCAVLAGGFVLSAGLASAAAGKRPVIVSMGSGAGAEITISAEIDPESLETSYELRLECGPGEPMACDELPNERTQGRLPPVEERREVSMAVTGLKPGKYWFGVSAVNAEGEASWSSDILTVPEVPPGACPNGCSTTEPYKPEPPSQASLEYAQREAERIAAKAEAERQAKADKELEAQHAKEHEEQEFKEAAARTAEATARKQREEQEQDKGGLSLAATSITVQRDGAALVKLECLGIAGCHGKLTLTAKSTAKGDGKGDGSKKKASVGSVTIGSAGFLIAGDEAKAVGVKLNAAGRALLSADHGRCSASLALLELAPSLQNTQTKTVQLVQQKAHGKAKK